MPYVDCVICNNNFYAKPNWIKRGWGKYCSRKCQFESQRKGSFIKCDVCDKEAWKQPRDIKGSKSGKFFCSKKCQTIWRNKYFSGERHPNWIDGSNQDYRRLMVSGNKKQVCKLCDNTDRRVLVVHHIDKRRSNNNLNNLTWLCHNCHYLVHNNNIKVE